VVFSRKPLLQQDAAPIIEQRQRHHGQPCREIYHVKIPSQHLVNDLV
jgi:hypothetical protein